jgi:hypothetical protein
MPRRSRKEGEEIQLDPRLRKLLLFISLEKIIGHENSVGEMHMIIIFNQIGVDEQPYLDWVAVLVFAVKSMMMREGVILT